MTSRTAKLDPTPNSQQPPQLAGASRRVLRFVEIGQNRLDPGQKVGADVGEDDRARGADEQRRADVTLERRDRARRRGLGNAKLPAGGGKTAAPGDAREESQSIQMVSHSRNG